MEKSSLIKRAEELRSIKTPHYNCAQAVAMPFACIAGVDEEIIRRAASNFGGGMKRGSVCGAVTGGLIALGLLGLDSEEVISEYYARLNKNHDGCLDCAALLEKNALCGNEKKPFCDGMVLECAALVEGLYAESIKR